MQKISAFICCLLCLCIYAQMTLWAEGTAAKKYQIVACAIFQNEAFFLHEWLEYHRLLGIEHFYLYNNLSNDQYAEILKPYLAAGIVELFEWPVETANQRQYFDLLQLPAYNHALNLAKDTAEWAAFIDLDEFILPMQCDDLYQLLQAYRCYGGLSINWQLFGTAWFDRLPAGELITENLVWKAPVDRDINRIVKLIVQPTLVKVIEDPHYFTFQDGYYAVDSATHPLERQQIGQPVVIDTICINHYWCGVKEWFIHNKVPRRAKWGVMMLPDEIEAILTSFNVIKDETILRFAPALKKRMSPQI